MGSLPVCSALNDVKPIQRNSETALHEIAQPVGMHIIRLWLPALSTQRSECCQSCSASLVAPALGWLQLPFFLPLFASTVAAIYSALRSGRHLQLTSLFYQLYYKKTVHTASCHTTGQQLQKQSAPLIFALPPRVHDSSHVHIGGSTRRARRHCYRNTLPRACTHHKYTRMAQQALYQASVGKRSANKSF